MDNKNILERKENLEQYITGKSYKKCKNKLLGDGNVKIEANNKYGCKNFKIIEGNGYDTISFLNSPTAYIKSNGIKIYLDIYDIDDDLLVGIPYEIDKCAFTMVEIQNWNKSSPNILFYFTEDILQCDLVEAGHPFEYWIGSYKNIYTSESYIHILSEQNFIFFKNNFGGSYNEVKCEFYFDRYKCIFKEKNNKKILEMQCLFPPALVGAYVEYNDDKYKPTIEYFNAKKFEKFDKKNSLIYTYIQNYYFHNIDLYMKDENSKQDMTYITTLGIMQSKTFYLPEGYTIYACYDTSVISGFVITEEENYIAIGENLPYENTYKKDSDYIRSVIERESHDINGFSYFSIDKLEGLDGSRNMYNEVFRIPRSGHIKYVIIKYENMTNSNYNVNPEIIIKNPENNYEFNENNKHFSAYSNNRGGILYIDKLNYGDYYIDMKFSDSCEFKISGMVIPDIEIEYLRDTAIKTINKIDGINDPEKVFDEFINPIAMYEISQMDNMFGLFTGGYSLLSGFSALSSYLGPIVKAVASAVMNPATLVVAGVALAVFAIGEIYVANSFNENIRFSVNNADYLKGVQKNWMGLIDDNKYLSDINIPGTHDSATSNLDLIMYAREAMWRCQQLTISQQLDIGVRFFDIRLALDKDNVLNLAHMSARCKKADNSLLDFHDVLEFMSEFLVKNPSETIIMLVKEEDKKSSEEKYAFMARVYSYIESSSAKDKMYYGIDIPKIKDVRGKIILMRKFTLKPAELYTSRSGIDVSAWEDYKASERKLFYPNENIAVQDFFSFMGSKEEKSCLIKSHLDKAISCYDKKLYINFLSIAGQPGNNHTYFERALCNYEWVGKKRYGVIVFDFVNEEWARFIYMLNFMDGDINLTENK